MALCSSTTSELACHCVVGLRGKNGSLYECKPFVRVGDSYSRKGHIQVTGQLMRGQLEGSSMGKKHLQEPGRKLEFVRTLLIDNYDSYTYNIYQELSTVNGCKFCSFLHLSLFAASIFCPKSKTCINVTNYLWILWFTAFGFPTYVIYAFLAFLLILY